MEVDSVKKHTKRLLPSYLTSDKPHGPINKAERSAGERAALEKRKNELLQSRTREQIEAEYSGQAVKINKHLERKARKNAEINEQLTQLKGEHDMEMRVIKANLTKRDEKREADAERQQQQQQDSNDFGKTGSIDPASKSVPGTESIEMTG